MVLGFRSGGVASVCASCRGSGYQPNPRSGSDQGLSSHQRPVDPIGALAAVAAQAKQQKIMARTDLSPRIWNTPVRTCELIQPVGGKLTPQHGGNPVREIG